jgi:hypothetical protein
MVTTEQEINKKMRGLSNALMGIADKAIEKRNAERKAATDDIIDDVIHQMCRLKCPYYTECQGLDMLHGHSVEGPWADNESLLNPEQLKLCIQNGFKHTKTYINPDPERPNDKHSHYIDCTECAGAGCSGPDTCVRNKGL